MPWPAVVPIPSSMDAAAGAAAGGPGRAASATAAPAVGAELTGDSRILIDSPSPTSAAIVEAIAAPLRARTGLALSLGAHDEAAAPHDITITIDPTGGQGPEGYDLESGDGLAIRSATAAGAFYAAQTLLQLLTKTERGWTVPILRIADRPRFAYRGVMLDVARHFFSPRTIEAYIDRAVSLKFNALHLHLSDDQGWRIEIQSWPRLTGDASAPSTGGDHRGFYTQDDYREIVAYAAARHMIVVPEIDLPGHTHALGVAYPELVEAPSISDELRTQARELDQALPEAGAPYTGWGVGFSSVRIHDEATSTFVADVFGELAALTPGPYLHLGGDEALGTAAEDYAAFVSQAAALVAATGKIPIGWHEAGAAADLPPGTIGQYWGFVVPTDGHDEKARAFVRNGGRVIFSPADAIYLDMKYDASTPLGLTWANGPTSVEHAYSWDPAEIIEGIDDAAILGVEAPLWTETVTDLHDIDTLAFPRIAAAAEIAWSPASGPDRSWSSFRERVGALGPLWHAQGIAYYPSPEIPWAEPDSAAARGRAC